MCRSDLPRVCELRDLIAQSADLNAYFSDFEPSLQEYPEKKAVWLAREREFQRLDQAAWDFLKKEALPYLTSRHLRRGWEQLISTLNLARAFCYLLDIGCANVRFIPRSVEPGIKTPDVEGSFNATKILCVVKTIYISDDEAVRRKTGAVGTTYASLDRALLDKIDSTLMSADQQLCAFDSSNAARHIGFVILNFDDSLAEYKVNYYREIDAHLCSQKIPHLEVVFFNQRTALPAKIVMNHASIVNEPAG